MNEKKSNQSCSQLQLSGHIMDSIHGHSYQLFLSTSTVKGLGTDGKMGVSFFPSSFTSVSVLLMTVSPTVMLVSTVRGSPDLFTG